jgi:hypothetical protein
MIFRIYHSSKDYVKEGDSYDYIEIEGETVEECRVEAQSELKKRNWDENTCWSVKTSD